MQDGFQGSFNCRVHNSWNLFSYTRKIKFAIVGHFRDGGGPSLSYLSPQKTPPAFWEGSALIVHILIFEIDINIMNGNHP